MIAAWTILKTFQICVAKQERNNKGWLQGLQGSKNKQNGILTVNVFPQQLRSEVHNDKLQITD